GDLDNIGHELQIAVKRDQYSKYNRYLYCQYLVLANRLHDAEIETRKLLALNSQYSDAWLVLAKVYQLQNRPDQFREAMNEAYKLRIDDVTMRALWRSVKNTDDIRKVKLDIVSLLGEI